MAGAVLLLVSAMGIAPLGELCWLSPTCFCWTSRLVTTLHLSPSRLAVLSLSRPAAATALACR
jgi:hypothetical protein